MELDLDRQEHGRSEIAIAGELELSLGEGRPEKASVSGQLAVQNIESRFLLSGNLAATGPAECGRCLRDFQLAWDIPVTAMVLRDVNSDEEDDGETLVILQHNGVVDLKPTLRECAVLAFPQSPVCGEACQGLCATCGQNLNVEACNCSKEDYDPRWEGLPD